MRVISLATSGPRTCAWEPLAVAVGATTCDVAATVATSAVGTGGVVVGDNGVGLTCARAVGVAADVGRPRTAGASVARTVGTASTDSVSTGSTGLLETQAVTTMATTTMVPECLSWLASVIPECAQAYVPRPRDSSPACWDLLSGPSDALVGSKPAAMAAPEQARRPATGRQRKAHTRLRWSGRKRPRYARAWSGDIVEGFMQRDQRIISAAFPRSCPCSSPPGPYGRRR